MARERYDLPCSPDPRVSVIVLAYSNRGGLERCLSSLDRNVGPHVSWETVIVANGATPEVMALLASRVSGARLIVSPVNLGFAGGCNRGAHEARGEFLALLNDDAEVQPGWLEFLVETADARPDAAAIGGRALSSDGSLHEAGSILWSDGSTLAVGRGLPGDSPRYGYVRQVDYCSASSLLVRRSIWDEVGGMDEEYHPAYCEDVDLCLAVERTGSRVLYEPRSCIRHDESSSSEHGFKDFLMARHRERLRRRWPNQLARREPPDGRSPAAVERAIFRARGFPRRVLAVDDSGHGRSDWVAQVIEELDPRGYAVSLFVADRAARPALLTPLGARGVEVLEEDLRAHLARPEILYDAVVVCDQQLALIAPWMRELQPQAGLLASGAGARGRWIEALSKAQMGRAGEPIAARR